MRNNLLILFTLLLGTFISCLKEDLPEEQVPQYFLSEIRPDYFENLNFESTTIRAGIPKFLQNFHGVFNELDQQYKDGGYVHDSDLEYMRLTSMYYSFYMLALTGTYLDGGLTIEDINGDRSRGLFSGLAVTSPDFAQKEMETMMAEAERVIYQASYINGFNDKTYGFYMAVKQVHGRLRNPEHKNDPDIHGEVIDYVATNLVNYDNIPVWNVLMSMVTMTNYEDALNTFDNPKMDELRYEVNSRLLLGSLADQGGVYPEILGPLYRFDVNLKKIDWLLKEKETLSEEDLLFLDEMILIMETAGRFIMEEKTDLINSWKYKNTLDERLTKLEELKAFRQNLGPKPAIFEFINSSNFKKAYQCYSCHMPSGL